MSAATSWRGGHGFDPAGAPQVAARRDLIVDQGAGDLHKTLTNCTITHENQEVYVQRLFRLNGQLHYAGYEAFKKER